MSFLASLVFLAVAAAAVVAVALFWFQQAKASVVMFAVEATKTLANSLETDRSTSLES